MHLNSGQICARQKKVFSVTCFSPILRHWLIRSHLSCCFVSIQQACLFPSSHHRIRLKNSPHSSVTEKASAENGIRSALIRYLLENSLLVSSLPNTARLCQLFFCFALFSISNSRKLSCCHSVREPTRNFLSHLQYDSCSPSLTDPKSIRISSYP